MRDSIKAALSLAFTFAIVVLARFLAQHFVPCEGPPCGRKWHAEFYLILGPCSFGVFLSTYFLYPYCKRIFPWFRNRWRTPYGIAVIVLVCAAIAAFVIHFGNRQFGGYDFSILIDTGWKLANGQKPYLDFVCTVPPGFYLGLKYAFILFGISWNAQLYATAILGISSFLWTYWLLSALVKTRTAAFLLAFTIVCAALLTLDFWWYNNVTEIAATIFFLSCLRYSERPLDLPAQTSYVASLALVGLMKPNIAGVLCAGAVLLVFLSTAHKLRTAVLSVAAVVLATGFLAWNGIGVFDLLSSYLRISTGWRAVALSGYGMREMPEWDMVRIILFFAALSTPLLLARASLRSVAYMLLFPFAFLVSLFAMFTNGELKDVSWAIVVAAGGVLVFHPSANAGRLRRFYPALLCALIFSDLYMGAVRFRVEGVGPHMFYEWNAPLTATDRPFFRDLKASGRFRRVVDQVGDALRANTQSVFLGPRMEFAYAAFGVPSPLHLPIWWHPARSFAPAQESNLLDIWRKEGFHTLIFLKDDPTQAFTYYSPQFMQLIETLYNRDDSYSDITVFHAR